MGRQSSFEQHVADAICERLTHGESLRAICRDDGMPAHTTVLQWANDRTEFAEQYARARDIGLDAMAEDLIDIADDGSQDRKTVMKDGQEVEVFDAEHVQRSKLRVDARKWYLSKLAPKRYGEKLALEHSADGTLADALLAARGRTG